jgi:AraC-like DNA-binding protein
MASAALLELLARGAAAGAFVGLAIIVLRGGSTPARITGALFSIAAAAHTLTQMPDAPLDRAFGWFWGPIWAFSVMGAGFFWAFVGELFEDRPRLEPWRFAPAAVMLAIGLGGALSEPAIARWFWLAHNLAGAALIAHALLEIAVGWRGDLVEERRRLRGPILAIGAAYALIVLLVQTGELFVGSAEAASPVAALVLVILAFLSLAAFGRADASLFGAVALAPTDEPSAETAPSKPLGKEDTAIIAALEKLMGEDKLYREEGLTITALALRLKVPEHRLRRVINQGLGRRNFSAFLNQWRLADAKAALGDPAQADVPVSTIALDAGFGSLGPFNRAFKAETGRTPSEFRAQALASSATTPGQSQTPSH